MTWADRATEAIAHRREMLALAVVVAFAAVVWL